MRSNQTFSDGMMQSQKRAERFSVESVKTALGNGRPSEALRAMAHLYSECYRGITGTGTRYSRYIIDLSNPKNAEVFKRIKEMRALVRDYEKETGTRVLGNEYFLRIRALRLRLRGK
jgi:hypothetical protein